MQWPLDGHKRVPKSVNFPNLTAGQASAPRWGTYSLPSASCLGARMVGRAGGGQALLGELHTLGDRGHGAQAWQGRALRHKVMPGLCEPLS